MQVQAPLHGVLLGCWLGLMLLISAPLFINTTASIGLWLMQAVPLLITLPGLLKLHSRTLLWLGFLIQFYFINGVLQVSSAAPAQRWLGALTLLLCLTLFTAVIVAVRSARKIKQLNQATASPTE
jgi:uncharacterized membrane protein